MFENNSPLPIVKGEAAKIQMIFIFPQLLYPFTLRIIKSNKIQIHIYFNVCFGGYNFQLSIGCQKVLVIFYDLQKHYLHQG